MICLKVRYQEKKRSGGNDDFKVNIGNYVPINYEGNLFPVVKISNNENEVSVKSMKKWCQLEVAGPGGHLDNSAMFNKILINQCKSHLVENKSFASQK